MQPLQPDGGADHVPSPEPSARRPVDRRQFLQFSALGAVSAAAGTRLTSNKKKPPARARRQRFATGPAVVEKKLATGVVVPTAPWLITENAKPGTLNWICNHVQPDHALEGFASQVERETR